MQNKDHISNIYVHVDTIFGFVVLLWLIDWGLLFLFNFVVDGIDTLRSFQKLSIVV
jgi:hypothetical protein